MAVLRRVDRMSVVTLSVPMADRPGGTAFAPFMVWTVYCHVRRSELGTELLENMEEGKERMKLLAHRQGSGLKRRSRDNTSIRFMCQAPVRLRPCRCSICCCCRAPNRCSRRMAAVLWSGCLCSCGADGRAAAGAVPCVK